MQRKALHYLNNWKDKQNRKPLVLRGAPQVGKTWLMTEFGHQCFADTAYINFDGNNRMKNLFEPDYDMHKITPDTLVILDEIQECPKALSSLKYFYEQAPQHPIIAAGSLLGVALHKGTSFPVGKVEFLDVFPMSFLEFLSAMGEDELLALLEKQDFGLIKTFQDKYINLLRQYYFVGGMPEVVLSFARDRDYQQARKLQKDILTAYEQDFSKYVPPVDAARIREVWHSIPAQLSKENKKFIYGAIREGARAKSYELALEWLQDCGLIYRVYRISKPNLPLSGYQDSNAFKLYMSDVGLLGALSNLSPQTLLNGTQIFTEFKGALTEQYVLQTLKTLPDLPVFYWTSAARAEVDFVLQAGEHILPAEVKAEQNLKAKSLKTYCDKYNVAAALRFSMADYKYTAPVYDIPLYMAELFQSILQNAHLQAF